MTSEQQETDAQIIEAILFSSRHALSVQQIAKITGQKGSGSVKKIINDLNLFYQSNERAFFIDRIAGGYQLKTHDRFKRWITKGKIVKPIQLSQTVMETLAIVAYQQPVTRAEIEEIRSVDATYALKTLLDRKLIKIAGRKDIIGRPLIYATSRLFLEVFGFNSLNDLPRPEDFDLLTETISADTETRNEY